MTAVTFGAGARQGRSLRLGAVAGIVAAMALLLVFALLSSRGSPSGGHSDLGSRQAALVSWEAAVQPLVESGGQVVALGPRKALGQMEGHTVTDVEMRTMATGWVRQLSQLQQQIAAVPTPQALRSAHEQLGTAMSGYVTASRDVLEATSATGARRAQLLKAAAAAGTAADHTYDLAVAAIAAQRAELSLPTDWSA
jgi:phosphatidylserine/phosphatidylglycerophosphate/cardiolipin synthase-like enzyme